MGSTACALLRTATKESPIGREDLDAIRGLEILLNEFSFLGVPTTEFVFGLDAENPVEWGTTNQYNEANFDPSAAAKLTTPEGQKEVLQLCRAADLGKDKDATRCDTRDCIIL